MRAMTALAVLSGSEDKRPARAARARAAPALRSRLCGGHAQQDSGCGPLLEKFRCGFGPGIRVFNHDSDSLIKKSRLLARRRWPGARGIGATPRLQWRWGCSAGRDVQPGYESRHCWPTVLFSRGWDRQTVGVGSGWCRTRLASSLSPNIRDWPVADVCRSDSESRRHR
jgi:hypothetical protein